VTHGDDVRLAQEIIEGRAEMAAKLAHEIRGPVSTLRGLAGTALAHYDGLSDDERREFLGLIRQEAAHLERTVEHVALALRLDAGVLRFDIRNQDLVAVARAAVLAVEAGDRPIEVEAPDALEAPVDAGHIGSVVRELVDNAATFSPPGSVIAVRVRREGDQALIEVADRGPGVPAEQRDAVFERFADWRPAGYEDRPGPGLGLYICRAVARGHGGEASVADNPGGGTMLTVRLPGRG
jgi:signal transduction histidine kinase